jgi:plasmid stability protein
MNLIIELTPESEARLKEQAADRGKDLAAYAREVLEDGLANESAAAKETLSAAAWRARFDAMLRALPQTSATFVDDSREAIYHGRGE